MNLVYHGQICRFLTFYEAIKFDEVFEALIIAPDSKFDLFLKGDTGALNQDETPELQLFMENERFSCHDGLKFE